MGYHTPWGSFQDTADKQTAQIILIKIQGYIYLWEIIGPYLTVETLDYDRQDDGTDMSGYGALIGGGTWEIQVNILWSDVTSSNYSEYSTSYLF